MDTVGISVATHDFLKKQPETENSIFAMSDLPQGYGKTKAQLCGANIDSSLKRCIEEVHRSDGALFPA